MTATRKRDLIREALKDFTPAAIILNEKNPAASTTPLGRVLTVVAWGRNSAEGIPHSGALGQQSVIGMACEYFVVEDPTGLFVRLFVVPRSLDHEPLHKLEQVLSALDADYGDDDEWGSQGGEPTLDDKDGGDNEAL